MLRTDLKITKINFTLTQVDTVMFSNFKIMRRKTMISLFLSIFSFLVAVALIPSLNSHLSKDSLFIDSISYSEYYGEDAR